MTPLRPPRASPSVPEPLPIGPVSAPVSCPLFLSVAKLT
ncbi:hypothetical protein STXM2123_3571 [Streptomyces sp. F-3]|nr:hypothetical protein STXM2123_3571 [Streptomyces sp. F-3]